MPEHWEPGWVSQGKATPQGTTLVWSPLFLPWASSGSSLLVVHGGKCFLPLAHSPAMNALWHFCHSKPDSLVRVTTQFNTFLLLLSQSCKDLSQDPKSFDSNTYFNYKSCQGNISFSISSNRFKSYGIIFCRGKVELCHFLPKPVISNTKITGLFFIFQRLWKNIYMGTTSCSLQRLKCHEC